MNLKLIAAILVITAVPVCAHAQNPGAAKVTNADAQKVLKITSGDKGPRPIATSLTSVSRSRRLTRAKMPRKPMS